MNYYCRECQVLDWSRHRLKCLPRDIGSAKTTPSSQQQLQQQQQQDSGRGPLQQSKGISRALKQVQAEHEEAVKQALQAQQFNQKSMLGVTTPGQRLPVILPTPAEGEEGSTGNTIITILPDSVSTDGAQSHYVSKVPLVPLHSGYYSWVKGRRSWRGLDSPHRKTFPRVRDLDKIEFNELVDTYHNTPLPVFSRRVRLSTMKECLDRLWINEKEL